MLYVLDGCVLLINVIRAKNARAEIGCSVNSRKKYIFLW